MKTPTRAEVLQPPAEGSLLDSFFGDYIGYGPEFDATTNTIAVLHNEGALDVLAAYGAPLAA
jgi:hypothetical protein